MTILSENNPIISLPMLESETDVAYLSYQHNILTVKMKEGAILNVDQMENLLKHAVKLTNFKKYFAVIDARINVNMSDDVRDFYAKSEYRKYRYADAFIVDSLAMRLLVNFYISFNKPAIPTKTFTNEESALSWINSLKAITEN